ncbi:MAG: site-2 protease family protein [Chloroflexi bacterium]|nr:site-2 protease family protein [Chloroflexota bacterium]
MALVSAAGPASNLLMALVCALGAEYLPDFPGTAGELATKVIETSFFLNIGLAAFNLLPLPPLDGFAVATGLLPSRMADQLERIEQFGPGILLLLVFAPSIIHFDILGLVISPIRRALIIAVLWVSGIG